MSDFLDLIDLAAERLGGAVLHANDDFFAPKENLLKPKAAVFLEHEYTDRGKWMDGWESRRRRTPGHDFCLVRLGPPGHRPRRGDRHGVLPRQLPRPRLHRSLLRARRCLAGGSARYARDGGRPPCPPAQPVRAGSRSSRRSPLRGDSKNLFVIEAARALHASAPQHLPGRRRRSAPGARRGRAGLRAGSAAGREVLDVAAVENGGQVLSCSDMFFGVRHNLIMPGRAANMGEGWETKRRRGPGYDWALLRLAGEATLARVVVDTTHFKGNYPDTCMLEGCQASSGRGAEGAGVARDVPRTKLQPHTQHVFDDAIADRGPFTHVRLNIYPDGGVSRLRLFGALTRRGPRLGGHPQAQHPGPPRGGGRAASRAAARARGPSAMAERRPFRTVAGALEAAGAAFRGLGREDWLEAFRAPPAHRREEGRRRTGGPGAALVGEGAGRRRRGAGRHARRSSPRGIARTPRSSATSSSSARRARAPARCSPSSASASATIRRRRSGSPPRSSARSPTSGWRSSSNHERYHDPRAGHLPRPPGGRCAR